jgi:hypothetical protein
MKTILSILAGFGAIIVAMSENPFFPWANYAAVLVFAVVCWTVTRKAARPPLRLIYDDRFIFDHSWDDEARYQLRITRRVLLALSFFIAAFLVALLGYAWRYPAAPLFE